MKSKFKVFDTVYFYDFSHARISAGTVMEIEYNGDDDYIYTCMVFDNSLRYIWESELEILPFYVEEMLAI